MIVHKTRFISTYIQVHCPYKVLRKQTNKQKLFSSAIRLEYLACKDPRTFVREKPSRFPEKLCA